MNLLDNTTNQPPKSRTKNWLKEMRNHEEHAARIVKVVDKTRNSLEFHRKIVQKQLQMPQKLLDLVEKYLKKDM